MVAGNWKMHGSLQSVKSLANNIAKALTPNITEQCLVAVLPTYVHLDAVHQQLSDHNQAVKLGAQDLSLHAEGAFTGQVSAQMLLDAGCRYVLVGHSERRQYCHEDNQVVAAKAEVALAEGLVPIICVGETQEQRDQGQTEKVVLGQIGAVLERCSTEMLQKAVVAYEPVWAIGTGLTATPSEAQSVHRFIRQAISAKSESLADNALILYGGSVKAQNAEDLFSMPDINGGLIGGASLNFQEFVQICSAAARIVGP